MEEEINTLEMLLDFQEEYALIHFNISGLYYKHIMIVNDASRVIIT